MVEKEQTAEEVLARQREKYDSNDAVKGTGLGNQGHKVGDRTVSNVNIYVDSDQMDNVQVPEKEDGIMLKKKRARDIVPVCYEGAYDPVPGGVVINWTNNQGTAGFPARDSAGDDGMLTAAHIFFDGDPYDMSSCPAITDRDCYQSGQFLGEVQAAQTYEDWAFVDDQPTDVSGFEDSIVSEPGTLRTYVSYNGLKDMKSRSESMKKKGVRTCTTYGIVQEVAISVELCGRTVNYFTRCSNDVAGGDSGSPHYRRRQPSGGGDYLDAIMVLSGTYNGNQALGVPAYHLHDSRGYSFGV